MEICAIVTSICTCACGPDIRGLCASWCLRCRNPKKKLEKLVSLNEGLTKQAIEKSNSIKQVKIKQGREDIEIGTVSKWLNDVTKKNNEVTTIQKKVQGNKKWMCGLVPNYWLRWKVGGEISKVCGEVLELQNKGDALKDIENLARRLPTKGEKIPVKMTKFNSTEGCINEILEYLMDKSVTRIGVYGMGGVGKTTLSKEVNNRLLSANKGFEYIHWVSTTKDFDLSSLQNAIAKSIGLRYTEEDEDQVRRASKLQSALMVKGHVVLILDNMWEAFALEDIGIPEPSSDNSCKIIITTRVLEVCRGMKTDKNVEIKELTEVEAWAMFKGIVVMDVLSKPKATQDIMKDVANECGGLPLAIEVVGKAMRNVNNDIQWKQTLKDLRYHGDNIITRDGKVLAALKLSYEMLTDNMNRSCFLYCALYPEGHIIESKELIEYWMWEGMLGDSEMLEDYMRKGEKVLINIVGASLLESTCEKNGKITSVKMHDMVREMAKSTSPRCLIQSGVGLMKPPYEGNWVKDLERISLMRNDLKELPLSPECPMVSTLLLQYNSLSNTISPNFFTHFISLKVLDLSFTGISSLPSSLSSMVSLEALLLRNCWYLVSVPSLARLKQLRVLDLSFTPITELPGGIEMLTNLRSINLSHTMLEVLPVGVFDKYTRLEHLLLQGWNLIWGSNAIGELFCANNLRVLHATFKDIQVFTIFVTVAENLQLHSFQLRIGQPVEEGCENNDSSFKGNGIKIAGCELGQNYILLPPMTTELCITVCFCDCLTPLVIYNSVYVQNFTISYCNEITSIEINEGDAYMASLEKMELKYMGNLRKLFQGNLHHGTLENLKILHISNCNSIKILLDNSWLQYLCNLGEISVQDCDAMEEIISMGEITSGVELDIQEHQSIIGTVKLPKLYKLHFSNLKILTSIINGILVSQSLCSIEVSKCPKLERLPCFNPAPRALSNIKGETEWWNKLKWDHASAGTKERFQPMFVEVEKEQQAECSYQDG